MAPDTQIKYGNQLAKREGFDGFFEAFFRL